MNEYKIQGDTTILYVRYKGEILEVLIDTDKLPLVQSYGTWYGNLIGNHIYIKCKYKYITYQLHRVILGVVEDVIVDHDNRNTLDNRRSNLISSNYSDNGLNAIKRKDNKSGITGVRWEEDRKKWSAKITYRGKAMRLGQYDTLLEAVMARVSAKNCILNKPTRKPIKMPS